MRSEGWNLLAYADLCRIEANRRLDPVAKTALAQFMTPQSIAGFMASLFGPLSPEVRLLDPGAGVGSLTAAFIDEMLGRDRPPGTVEATAYELDDVMLQCLHMTLEQCRLACSSAGVVLRPIVIEEDFVAEGVATLQTRGTLFDEGRRGFTHCIMNPPYRKIATDSPHRLALRAAGVETSNIYAGFVALATMLLEDGGELVAIIPRSFCNGPYFRPFRQLLFTNMAIRSIHVFEARDQAFSEDEVLQENVIIHGLRGAAQGDVTVTSSVGPDFSTMTCRSVPFHELVRPDDPDKVLHVVATEFDRRVAELMATFTSTLSDLEVEVCTGPVVDFRLRDAISDSPTVGSVPLIYATHLHDNYVAWPMLEGRKPNAIRVTDQSRQWLMPNGWYTLTKRFTSKEERRRIVASIHDPGRAPGELIGFENHLNVFHSSGRGLEPDVAKGLAVYLNTTIVDLHFRQWSGHTQVNATDLRMMRYPSLDVLRTLGERVGDRFPNQRTVDETLERETRLMDTNSGLDPVAVTARVDEATEILRELGLPGKQINDRSAYTLLALVKLRPDRPWSEASDPRMGITPIMEYVATHYGRQYAPNSRETFRKETMHQFVDAGIAVQNPDDPARATNSPKWCYQIAPATLRLLRTRGTESWEEELAKYRAVNKTLAERYGAERDMQRIPLVVGAKVVAQLSPGDHSELIKAIIEEFGPCFAPGSTVLYIGDTGDKTIVYEVEKFAGLGLKFDHHGKFPDVVLYDERKGWLLLVESVTSVGPVDAKRHAELSRLFGGASAPIVYVTAFPNRQTMAKFLPDISWETEVWVADSPTHLIHFNGERFLGPYCGLE